VADQGDAPGSPRRSAAANAATRASRAARPEGSSEKPATLTMIRRARVGDGQLLPEEQVLQREVAPAEEFRTVRR
jgi:hypothetical protein